MPVFAQLFDTVTAHNGVQVWTDQNAQLKNSTHKRVDRAVIHRKMCITEMVKRQGSAAGNKILSKQ